MTELKIILGELNKSLREYLESGHAKKTEELGKVCYLATVFEEKFNDLYNRMYAELHGRPYPLQNKRIIQMTTKTPKSVTEFSESCDGPNSGFKWLGIARLSRIPDAGWPGRSDCQKAVAAEERAAGVKLVAEYRENEQITIDHDADSRRREMSRLSPDGHGFERARLRKELEACCIEHFLRLKAA
jgi:hypothetical protein